MGGLLKALGTVASGFGMGMLNDNREYTQNVRNQKLQIKGQKEMADYNLQKQMELWEATGYGAQRMQMEKAGLNPGLMYGMGGGGGQTAAANSGSVGAGSNAGKGMEIGQAMELALMKAQKENIEADTKNKLTDAGFTGGVKTDNTVADTDLKTYQRESIGLDNAVKAWINGADEYGNAEVDMKDTIAVKTAVGEMRKVIADAKLSEDENIRREKILEPEIRKITQEISLMKAKGMTEEQIFKNLVTDGKMKELELRWMEGGLTKETLGKFMLEVLKRILK